MSADKNIHMIGCAGGIGKWMLEKIFDTYSEKSRIYCYDVNAYALEQLPEHIEKCLLTPETGYAKFQRQFESSDWVIFGVPLNHLESSVRNISGYIKNDSLLISLTSTQVDAMKILSRYSPANCTFIGCHPLFGISLNSPVSQVAILVDYHDTDNQHQQLKKCLTDTGLFINEMSAVEHDSNMSVVQALTHFTYLTFAHVVGSTDYELSQLTQTTTPSFQYLLAFASRVLRIAPTTTGSIQTTSDAQLLRDLFQKSAIYLNEQFRAATSIEDYAAVIEDIRKPFQAKDTSKVAGIAATAVAGRQRIEELFYKYIHLEKPFIFRNKLSGNIHIVRITDMGMDGLVYQEASKVISINGEDFYASGLDPVANDNYKKQGINITRLEDLSVLKKNVELLSAGFLADFRENRILHAESLIQVNNPNHYSKDFFQTWLPLLVKDLNFVEYQDSYMHNRQAPRLTLNIKFNPAIRKQTIINRITKVIEKSMVND